MKVVFNDISHKKIILHAMKYPDHRIDGILIGYFSECDEELHITDSFPLTHGPKLSQYITIGLQYIQEYCNIFNNSNKFIKVGIVGYYYDYFKNETSQTCDFTSYLKLLSEKILANNDNSIGVALNYSDYFSEEVMFIRSLKTEKPLEYSGKSVDSIKQQLTLQVKNLSFHKLNDFEDHLLDPSLNFINSDLTGDE